MVCCWFGYDLNCRQPYRPSGDMTAVQSWSGPTHDKPWVLCLGPICVLVAWWVSVIGMSVLKVLFFSFVWLSSKLSPLVDLPLVVGTCM